MAVMVGRGAMTNSIAELENAKLIFATGTNTTETHPVLALRVKRAVSKGAKLIVADPRRIELTTLAHRWMRLRIGTDIPLYNAMAHVIIKEGLYNKEYVERRTEGIEELAEFVKGYTPQVAEKISGVPAQDIIDTRPASTPLPATPPSSTPSASRSTPAASTTCSRWPTWGCSAATSAWRAPA